jgi:hypothetical protein
MRQEILEESLRFFSNVFFPEETLNVRDVTLDNTSMQCSVFPWSK